MAAAAVNGCGGYRGGEDDEAAILLWVHCFQEAAAIPSVKGKARILVLVAAEKTVTTVEEVIEVVVEVAAEEVAVKFAP